MRKLKRELHREYPDAIITPTNGGHYKIKLPGIQPVFVSSTPGGWRFMRNVRTFIRRQNKK